MLCRIMACKSCQPSYVMSRHIMSCHDHLYLHLFFTKQIGFNIAPKEDTTLNEMLVLGLDKFVEELTEISGRAAKEFSLEKVCKSYHNPTLQVATILVAMATRILELATKFERKSPARRLKLT